MNAESMSTLQCRRCKEVKPLDQMKKDTRNTLRGYSSFCKLCHRDASVAWQKENPEKVNATRRAYQQAHREAFREKARRYLEHHPDVPRKVTLKRLYGATLDWYEKTLADQGWRCAICGVDQSAQAKRFSVDHNHACCDKAPTCGKCTRGLLCNPCNLTLHKLDKHPDWINNALSYLEKHR